MNLNATLKQEPGNFDGMIDPFVWRQATNDQ
jgi:hypothetical protein